MTGVGEDTELEPPQPPASIPARLELQPGLTLAGPAGAGRLLVEGERTVVEAEQRRPVGSIEVAGHRVGPLDVDLGAAANVVVTPGLARREWIGHGGTTLETIVAAPTLPLVVIHLESTAVTAGRRGEILVSIPSWPGDRGGRIGSSSVAWKLSGADGADRVAVGVVPTPERIEVVSDRSGDAALRIVPASTTGDDGPSPVALLIAAGSPGRVRAAFGAAAHLSAQTRLAQEGPRDGLSLTTGVADVDEGSAWARARLRRALAHGGASHDPFWSTLAAVGVGDAEAATAGLAASANLDPYRRAILAAGIVRTFGDARPAFAAARELTALRGSGPEAGGGERPNAGTESREAADAPVDRELAAAACHVLANALHGSASPEMIEELRGAAPTPERPAGGRALPMAGGAGAPAPSSPWRWTAALLDGEPPSPPPDGHSDESVLFTLPALFRADPDRAWLEWRSRLEEGLRDGPMGPGTWGDTVTSALLTSLCFGLLGLAVDAPVNRLRIAPKLPSHLTRFRADGITAGATRLAMSYERDDALHRFVLDPAIAAVPPSVVFEPAVPGTVRSVRVDGREAELDVRRDGNRAVVPLQLPVDAPRTIEIVTAT